ncbi:F-box/LRR-repeat protein 16 [Bagarius yarrelli]|uniref:F-box/LRR-repeat protein 16 n=1 Tax=Bagarius yarrelli TaxID=175774 RepID=A0A556VC97_BAGYA|nr:F-box/LRR-repeat protein 16 [Bagarius yarrelli]
MSTPSELKSPCVTRNGMVKLPPQPNGLGSASITKGTPAAKNRLCQASSVPSSLPYHLEPLPMAGDGRQYTKLERHLALDEKVLNRLLWYFTTAEKCALAQVCKTWRKVLYQPKFWEGVTPVLHAKELYNTLPNGEKEFVSLQAFALRGFHSFCLVGVSDLDICEFIDNYPLSKKGVKSLSLKRSTITDAGLEHASVVAFVPLALELLLFSGPVFAVVMATTRVVSDAICALFSLECSHGSTDQHLEVFQLPKQPDRIPFCGGPVGSSLNARSSLTSLSVSDCINVADDAVAAISQLLPNLCELSLQAYHVTDTAMAYFTAKQGCTTRTLRLHSCWEITNHGVVNMVHSLPNLTALSLSGCSKITDDGVELVAENLRKLRSGSFPLDLFSLSSFLDLSWCPRITDVPAHRVHRLRSAQAGGACSRSGCVRITDTGLGYLSTMSSLRSLYLRWCCQKHVDLIMSRIFRTESLIQLQDLEELELTNCPGATAELFKYYSQHLPRCMVIE